MKKFVEFLQHYKIKASINDVIWERKRITLRLKQNDFEHINIKTRDLKHFLDVNDIEKERLETFTSKRSKNIVGTSAGPTRSAKRFFTANFSQKKESFKSSLLEYIDK